MILAGQRNSRVILPALQDLLMSLGNISAVQEDSDVIHTVIEGMPGLSTEFHKSRNDLLFVVVDHSQGEFVLLCHAFSRQSL